MISRAEGLAGGSAWSNSVHNLSRSSGTSTATALGHMSVSSDVAASDRREGSDPVNDWNSITPKLYQSVAWSTGNPAACSGDTYAGVPARTMLWSASSDASCTNPKSSN